MVGAGVFGASTARELALRGWDVTLVEQYTPGTVRSASGGDTRLSALRARRRRVVHAQLARRARTLWLELEEETGHADLGAGRRRVVRAARGRLRGAEPGRRSTRLGIPCEWLAPGGRARPLSVARRRRPARACSTSPTPACCTRGARHSCSSRTAIGTASAFEAGRRRRPTTAARRRRRLGVRRLAAEALPAHVELRISRRDVFFFGADATGAARRASATTTRRSTATASSAGSASRSRPTSPARRSTRTRSSGCPSPTLEQRGARVRRETLPGARRRAGRRRARLPVRPDRRHALPRRAGIPSAPRGGWSAAAPATASSTARRSREYVADCIEGGREPEPFHALGAAHRRRRAAHRGRSGRLVELGGSRASNASISLRRSAFSCCCSAFVSAEAKNASCGACTLAAVSQACAPSVGQLDHDAAPVLGIRQPPHEAGLLEPVEPARHRAARSSRSAASSPGELRWSARESRSVVSTCQSAASGRARQASPPSRA